MHSRACAWCLAPAVCDESRVWTDVRATGLQDAAQEGWCAGCTAAAATWPLVPQLVLHRMSCSAAGCGWHQHVAAADTVNRPRSGELWSGHAADQVRPVHPPLGAVHSHPSKACRGSRFSALMAGVHVESMLVWCGMATQPLLCGA
jgi:hypothetical protein